MKNAFGERFGIKFKLKCEDNTKALVFTKNSFPYRTALQ